MRAVLDSLSPEIALLDRTGRILFVNAAWRRFAGESGLGLADGGVGTSYLAPCDAAAAEVPVAGEAAARIREAIAGRDEEVQVPYTLDCSDGVRWFILRVTALGEGEKRRVVVSHADVSVVVDAEAAVHELTARLLVAQDEERRRIARELHDGTASTMVALSLDLTRLVEQPPAGRGTRPRRGLRLALRAVAPRAATVSFVLHPPLLERAGLVVALQWLADGFSKRSGIPVTLHPEDAPRERLPPYVELTLYRIVQEALTNVHRHSGSRTARVDLVAIGGEVRVTIRDEGTPPEDLVASDGGVGIASMRERVSALGGRLELRSGGTGRW